jgi:hypothetical protein
MKRDPLERLLKNAALAKREEAAPEMAFPAQARILAAWRAARDESEAFLPLLRKAILAAGAVTVLALAFTLLNVQSETTPEVDEMAVATNLVNDAIDLAVSE